MGWLVASFSIRIRNLKENQEIGGKKIIFKIKEIKLKKIIYMDRNINKWSIEIYPHLFILILIFKKSTKKEMN